nr:TetR/AcrR family transcriptional regulator [Pseudomonas sp. RIT-PI-S]
MFNEHGERSISTNHIAAAADISPGNLYYHFANKQQIVAVLFARYQGSVSQVLLPPVGAASGIERLRDCVGGVITAIWDYRFIYRDLEHLIQADPALAADHQAFSVDCLREARNLLEGLCGCGMLDMTAQAQQAVAINAWLILTSWVRYLYTTLPAPAITPAAVRRGAWQALSLLQGFATPQASSAVAALMAEFKGGDRAETSPRAMAPVSGTSA